MQGQLVADIFCNSLETSGSWARAFHIAFRLEWPSFGCHRSHEFLYILNLLRAEQTTAVPGMGIAGLCLILANALEESAAEITPVFSLLRLPPGAAPTVTN